MERLDSIGRRNGMFNKDISKKVHETLKRKRESGELIPYMKGKKNPFFSEYNRTHPRKGKNHPMYGKKHKNSTKEKISEIRLKQFKEKTIIHPRGMLGKENKWGHHTEETIKIIKEKRAKQIFPKKDTSIEIKVQNFLKQLKKDFFTHHYIKEIEHSYQCDILIPSMNLVIECDGDYWHGNKEMFSDEKLTERIIKQRVLDNKRTKELLEKGFKVLRLWENEIKIMNINQFENKLI